MRYVWKGYPDPTHGIQKTKIKNERYLITQDNTIYNFEIKLSLLSIEQDKSKLQTFSGYVDG